MIGGIWKLLQRFSYVEMNVALVCMGIAAFVRRQRMQTALAMLEEGRHTVLEVARHVGYSNPGHFARVFRNQHGCLPSDVRR